MKSRALRAVFVLLALAAQAGAGYQVWQIDERIAAARSGATDFDRKARLAVLALAEIRAAEQAYVAEGQVSDTWMARVDGLVQATAPRLSELRVAATAAEAQGGLEAAVESFSAFGPSDAKARDYVRSGQRLSASDVIFTDGASLLTKATNAVDTSRGQESVAREIGIAVLRQQLLYWIGGAALVTLLVLLLLFPIPVITAGERAGAGTGTGTGTGTETVDAGSSSFGGLGISKVTPDRRAALHELAPGLAAGETAAPTSGTGSGTGSGSGPAAGESTGPDLQAVADICGAFALVEDPRDLHGLLERIARALDATGLIVWMADNQQGPLRQVLAYGYAPLSLTRMGTIDPAADNATAVAFRTKSVQVVAAEAHSSGAIVAPLVTSDGCSGTLSVELKEGVRTTPQLTAVATILAAQLATLITPSAPGGTPEPPAARV